VDTIYLKDLRVTAIIGIWEWERRLPQVISIDLEMGVDIREAAKRDHIDATLNYKTVAKRVAADVGAAGCQLIETLAERIATLVMTEFGVPWIRVTVRKPFAVRGSREVGVSIERGAR